MQKYLQSLIIKSYETFSNINFHDFDSSTNNYHELYDCLTEWACHSHIERCLTNTAQALKRHLHGIVHGEKIDIPLQQFHLIRKYGIQRSNWDIFKIIWKILAIETNVNERTKIIEAIMSSKNKLFKQIVLFNLVIEIDQSYPGVIHYSENDRQQILEQFITNQSEDIHFILNFFTIKYLKDLKKM